ncbi:Proteasome subunit beta type-6 [Sesamum angolense]|uniref:Proteasome subunit beta type-6 n=1 Tax=Sesamum angolense TaxID=2727404 RepID=A0AAE1WEL5_9LAMI|nr:Proteasome subunit beta type-6 [Sesamum angolense]
MDSGDVNAPHSMGTTIIGVTYDGGVVLGADSRTSTGMYVANRASDKITQLTDNVYVCRSGSVLKIAGIKIFAAFEKWFSELSLCSLAADSQIVSDYVRYFLHQHTIQLGQPSTVKVAANLVRLLSYNNKNMLQTGLIVGGWDKYEGGKIYGIPLGGTVLELPFTIGGSGSSYLYGFFDQAWKEGMTREEAEQLVVKAVSLAIARDGASGGVVRTVTINKDGVTRKFYPGDTLPLWHEEMEPQNSLLDTLSAASPEPMGLFQCITVIFGNCQVISLSFEIKHLFCKLHRSNGHHVALMKAKMPYPVLYSRTNLYFGPTIKKAGLPAKESLYVRIDLVEEEIKTIVRLIDTVVRAAASLIWKDTVSKISIQAHLLDLLRGKYLDASYTVYKLPECII